MTAGGAALHYLALGDSYTIGEAVVASACWPNVLVRRLRQVGVVIDDPLIVAVTGWTTDELEQHIDALQLMPPWDLVSLQIGVNNQYRGRPADDYREQFTGLLERAIGLASDRPDHVLVTSIPDWGVTRFAREQGRDSAKIADELDAYNAIARAEARRVGAGFVDITGISRQHPLLLADDSLHPSAEQYALWAEAILPAALAATRPSPAR